MRILVFGGRTYPHRHHVWAELDGLTADCDPAYVTEIDGDATGADTHGKEWAWAWAATGVKRLPFPAKWSDLTAPGAVIRQGKYGPYNIRAGFDRNQRMLDEGKPTHALGFPGGDGTADMIARIHAANRGGANIILRLCPYDEGTKRAGQTVIGHLFVAGPIAHRCRYCGWPKGNHPE